MACPLAPERKRWQAGNSMTYVRRWGWMVIFVLLTGVFFYQTILYQKLPVPSDTLVGLYHPWRDLYADRYPRGIPFKNFLITDPVRQQIPWRKVVVDAWKEGRWPRWNPYAFAGVPLDGNIQTAPFYPLNILFFLFEFSTAWTMLIMLQPFLAGVFMYSYLRTLKLSEASRFVGAVAWAFGGFSVSWLTWGTMMQTAAWLPLMLVAIDKNKLALLGLAVVMTILAGHMQIALYTLLAAVSYLLWRKKFTKQVVFVFVAALIITSVQWLPFIRSLMESGRVAAEGWKQAGWFLPWQHLAQFIAPDFFGNPATMNYWGVWNYGEFIGFIGVIPLILALSAFRSSKIATFFTWVAGLSLFFMLPHPLSRLPLPLQPTRLMVLVDFSLAVLAAYGLDALRKKSSMRSIWIFGGALIILWVIALTGNIDVAKRNLILPSVLFGSFVVWNYFKRYSVLLVLLIIFDLFRFGWKFTPFTPKAYFFPTTKVIEFLQNQPKPFRIMSLDDRILPPNVSAYYGIETIEGYDPVSPKTYEDYLVASERGEADLSRPTGFNRIYTAKNVDSPILPYFNVRYVLSLINVERPFLKEVMREGETRVYEYTRRLPRVYLADNTTKVQASDKVLSALFTQTSSFPAVYTNRTDLLDLPVLAQEQATIISVEPNRIRARITVMSERMLVILNRYDARARATIDGKNVAVFPVNYLFTGTIVPSGTHDVILSY